MVPVVIVAAAVAAAQYYQSEKARGANKKRLKELEADFNRLVPPEYDLSIMDPPDYIKQALPEPTFDMSALTPEQYKLVGKYTPEIAPLVLEQRPELIKETAGMKEGRKAQVDALRKLKSIAANEQGDPELADQIFRANRSAQTEAQSRQASILQDQARRGTMGSGAGLATALQGQSDSMNRAADASRLAAVEAYKSRLQALKDSATLGGQVFNADMAMEGQNTDIINSFNQRTAKNAQDWQYNRAGTLNDAQRYNLDKEQSLSNMNTETANDFMQKDRSRKDALTEYLYNAKKGERDRLDNIAETQAKWRRDERDNQNTLKGKQFDDQYRITAGKQGLGVQGMQMNTQDAQDKNAAIGGVGNAVTSGYMYSEDQKRREKDEEERKKRYGEY